MREQFFFAHSLRKRFLVPLVVVLFGVISFITFYGHTGYGLFDVDEAIFTQATIEMMDKGNYIEPSYNNEPRYHKPPLIYWVQSWSLDFFGQDSLFGARFASACFSFLTIIGFFTFLLGLTSSLRFATTATMVLVFNMLWMIVSRAAIADAALNFFSLMSTMALLSAIYTRKNLIFWQLLAGLLLAGGLLTKGPVALFVPGVATLTAWFARPGFMQNVRATNPVIVGTMMIIGVTPWVFMIVNQSGWAFFSEFFLVHNFARFSDGLGNSHSSSGLYYIFVLLIGFFPWVLLVPGALTRMFYKFKTLIRSTNPLDALPAIGAIWFIVVVVFFSFSATKLVHYIVPALSGASLLLAWRIEDLGARRWLQRTYLAFILPFVILYGLFFIGFNALLNHLGGHSTSATVAWLLELFQVTWPVENMQVMDILSQSIPLNVAPYAIGAIVLIAMPLAFMLLAKSFRAGMALLAATNAMVLVLFITGLVPVIYAYTQQSLTNLANYIQENGQEAKIYHISLHQPSVRLISQRPFIWLDYRENLAEQISAGRALVLVEKQYVSETKGRLKGRIESTHCDGAYCVVTLDK